MTDQTDDLKVESFDELMGEKTIVNFTMNGRVRSTELVEPQVKDVDAIHKLHAEHMASSTTEIKDMTRAERLEDNFKFFAEMELEACMCLRATMPSARKKSDKELIAFVRKVEGGAHSDLLVTARRLCGMMLYGEGRGQTRF